MYRVHWLLVASNKFFDKQPEKPCSVLHALMCSVSVVTVVFIHTMEDDQRLNTLVHEDTFHFSIAWSYIYML